MRIDFKTFCVKKEKEIGQYSDYPFLDLVYNLVQVTLSTIKKKCLQMLVFVTTNPFLALSNDVGLKIHLLQAMLYSSNPISIWHFEKVNTYDFELDH